MAGDISVKIAAKLHENMQFAASFSINILIRQLSKNDTNIDDC